MVSRLNLCYLAKYLISYEFLFTCRLEYLLFFHNLQCVLNPSKHEIFQNTRLSKYLKILSEEQNGCREGGSCSEHAFVSSYVIVSRMDEKRNTFVACIDF